MPLIILQTGDLSNTLFNEELGETYHSRNGAMNESMHVFINNGLIEKLDEKGELNILEVGFGTGLNAALTITEASARQDLRVFYHTLETFPLSANIYLALNYEEILPAAAYRDLLKMHEAPWNEPAGISENFVLYKDESSLENFKADRKYDLIYFDAFAPDKQPELWTASVFMNLFNAMHEGGILVTYSSKGDVKRAMREAGFTVQRLKGPPGKHHMLRATKNIL